MDEKSAEICDGSDCANNVTHNMSLQSIHGVLGYLYCFIFTVKVALSLFNYTMLLM